MTMSLPRPAPPGCGKSTWAEKVTEGDSHGRAVRINRDDIRTVLAGDGYHSHGPNKKVEKQVTALRDQLISECLTSGKFDTVISDDTNLNRNTVRELYVLADKNGAEVSHQYFDVPVEEAVDGVDADDCVGGETASCAGATASDTGCAVGMVCCTVSTRFATSSALSGSGKRLSLPPPPPA